MMPRKIPKVMKMSNLPDSCYDYRYEAPKAKVYTHCDVCGDPIYVGDSYYEILNDERMNICNDCINSFKTIAEEE